MGCCGDEQEPAKDLPPAADAEETPEKFHAFLEAANGPARWARGRSGRWPLPCPCWPAAAPA